MDGLLLIVYLCAVLNRGNKYLYDDYKAHRGKGGTVGSVKIDSS
jgi:hypothetical protein